MKYKRITAGYTWTNYKTNGQIAGCTWDRLQNKCTNYKGVKNNTNFGKKLLEYERSWIQHVNRMPRNRLRRVMKHYSRTGRRIMADL